MWRLDYISSENSKGFHAAQESARILGESIDYSRQAQSAALRLNGQIQLKSAGLPSAQQEGTPPEARASNTSSLKLTAGIDTPAIAEPAASDSSSNSFDTTPGTEGPR